MPIYEYICHKCHEKFSLLQSLCPEPVYTECPKCSSTDVRKVVSSFSCSGGAGDSSVSAPRSFGGGG